MLFSTTPAFWTYKDFAVAVALVLPTAIAGAVVGRILPLHKTTQELAAQMLMYLLWFLLIRFLFRIQYQRPLLDSLGWINNGWLFVAVLIGIALAFGVSALGVRLHAPEIDPPYKALLTDRRSLALFALAGVLAGPIAEELAFRGLLMPLFAKSMPGLVAAVATAIPFALLHGPGFKWSWQHVLLIFLAGCVFGFVRDKLNSTLASAATHSAYNLTFLAGYLANG
jgi:membrane protease YdiL (CAAX protease family)